MSADVGSSSPSPTATGLPHQGTDPYSGWMSRFNPTTFHDQVYNDPQIVLQQMYQDNGWNTSGPGYSNLRNLSGADPQSLWMLLSGQAKGYHGGDEEYGNFLKDLYTEQGQVGGRTIDFNEIMAMIAHQGDQSGLTPEQQSPLWQMLTAGSAADQFRTTYGLVGDAAKMGLAPGMANAYMDAMARQGDRYLSDAATTQNAGTIPDYFQYMRNPGR